MSHDMPADEEVDEQLRSAMKARAEPDVSSNLAMRAMARARAAGQQTDPNRAPKRSAVEVLAYLSAVAALLIVLTIGIARVLAIRAVAEQFAYVAASGADSSDEVIKLVVLGCVALTGACVYLATANQGEASSA